MPDPHAFAHPSLIAIAVHIGLERTALDPGVHNATNADTALFRLVIEPQR